MADITELARGLRFVAHVAMPDAFTTNICFGGADLRTAYITLSQMGCLVAMPWPRPGLALHYQHR
jgi:gluconolactonase